MPAADYDWVKTKAFVCMQKISKDVADVTSNGRLPTVEEDGHCRQRGQSDGWNEWTNEV